MAELAVTLEACLQRFDKLMLFKEINIHLNENGDGADAKGNDDPPGRNRVNTLVLDVQERKCRLNAGTEIQARGDIGLALSGQLFNVCGRGERLESGRPG